MNHKFRMVSVFCAHAIGSVYDHIREYTQKLVQSRPNKECCAPKSHRPAMDSIGMPPVNVYMLRRRKNYELPN